MGQQGEERRRGTERKMRSRWREATVMGRDGGGSKVAWRRGGGGEEERARRKRRGDEEAELMAAAWCGSLEFSQALPFFGICLPSSICLAANVAITLAA